MKKLLLSSIIMFGICGFVTAQNATGSKLGKTQATATSAAPTPQKAAVEPALATNDVDPVKPASSKTNAVAAPAPNVKSAKVVKPAEAAVAVSADGVIIANDAAKKKEIEKAEAAAAKKNKDN